jgi:hypothetical protein
LGKKPPTFKGISSIILCDDDEEPTEIGQFGLSVTQEKGKGKMADNGLVEPNIVRHFCASTSDFQRRVNM